ncbi:MAG: response regulator transcription factor [Bryobacter sp.]|jgi:DNA-binding NarL/FixJ family response regulator|nr:response regulator transcription factor [Bryobacter sp. CoA8 C33]
MPAIRLFLCEAQPVVVEGLRRILESQPEIELVGTASNPSEALPSIRTLQPDVILLDQAAGIRTVFNLLSELRTFSPLSRVVLWVVDLAEIESFRLLQLGARGILRRTLPIPALIDCLHTVAKGNLWLENALSDHVVGFLNRKSPNRLTPREREIVRAVCRGMKNKEIAGLLQITPGTVKVHLMHIFEKTGVKGRFELAVQGQKLLGIESEQTLNPH